MPAIQNFPPGGGRLDPIAQDYERLTEVSRRVGARDPERSAHRAMKLIDDYASTDEGYDRLTEDYVALAATAHQVGAHDASAAARQAFKLVAGDARGLEGADRLTRDYVELARASRNAHCGDANTSGRRAFRLIGRYATSCFGHYAHGVRGFDQLTAVYVSLLQSAVAAHATHPDADARAAVRQTVEAKGYPGELLRHLAHANG